MSTLEAIDDGDALLRRIPNSPDHWERSADGVLRVRSAAFVRAKSDQGVSVDVRRLLPDPLDPVACLGDRPTHGLIEFLAALPRAHGLDVVHAPEPDNAAHANIIGFPSSKPARKRVRLELAKAPHVWVQHPGGAGA